MKLVDVAEFYAEQGGGVRTYIDHKLRAGRALGHEVVVVAPGPTDAEEPRAGGRIIWVKSPRVPGDPRYHLFSNERRVHAVLDAERPDVLEGSSVYGGGWFAARWKGPALKSLVFHQDPVAVFGHTMLDRWVPRPLIDRAFLPVWAALRSLSRRVDTTVVASQWLQGRLQRHGVINAHAVPFGIDPGPFVEAEPDPSLRAELLAKCGRPSAVALLVAVCRLHPEKRVPVLIDALPKLGPDYALVIFGDGPSRDAIEKRARATEGVHLAGYTRDRPSLARAVASADIFVHGSAAETYGLVVAEALAAGVPVVVPSAGGAAEVADEARSERYTPGDPRALAAAVRALRAKRDEGALTMGRQRVRTLDDHFRELFEHYCKP